MPIIIGVHDSNGKGSSMVEVNMGQTCFISRSNRSIQFSFNLYIYIL